MAIELEVSADVVDVHVRGADVLWGFRRHLEIPVSRIAAVRVVAAAEAKRDVLLRTAGLGFPGLAAVGYFRGTEAPRQWWRVYRADRVLVIDLAPQSSFDRIVLQVDDPDETARRIAASLEA